eukprot:CAMPEP_0178925734 /NCGR_PEP_ID=MMETSP0786-20121207/18089_1 /TAXON_ID=186022 /ORGANISM="Thalassionema frauenfeldii, Strain CCMP 1798" /LENGTH=1084 /DNA_ID=CAMNT_0020600673 /DNA_START=367 /DNA_END=3618 /DNA_ORIENTATION=-
MTNSVSSQSLQRKRPIQQQQQQQQQSRTRSHSVTSIQRRRRNNSHYWCSIVLLILGCSVQANDSNNTFFDRFGTPQTCLWLAGRPLEQPLYCTISDAFTVCPSLCQPNGPNCTVEDDMTTTLDENYPTRTCAWLEYSLQIDYDYHHSIYCQNNGAAISLCPRVCRLCGDETNIPTAAPVYAPPVAPNTANDYITPVSIPSFTPSIATIDTGYEPAPSPLHVMTLEPDAACSVCGQGRRVTAPPGTTFPYPDGPLGQMGCHFLEAGGLMGAFPNCDEFPSLISDVCQCAPFESAAPVTAPPVATDSYYDQPSSLYYDNGGVAPIPLPSDPPSAIPPTPPTPVPTPNPTPDPTPLPTPNPTPDPTPLPTPNPTPDPTPSPPSPSSEPSSQFLEGGALTNPPSKEPSRAPTPFPTTAIPSASPSARPSVSPSITPTASPSDFEIPLVVQTRSGIFMDLGNTAYLNQASVLEWQTITSQTIQNEIMETHNDDVVTLEVQVDLTDQTLDTPLVMTRMNDSFGPWNRRQRQRQRGRRQLRKLEDNMKVLHIVFSVTLKIRTTADDEHELNQYLHQAFNSLADQQKYVLDLRESGIGAFKSTLTVGIKIPNFRSGGDANPIVSPPTTTPTRNEVNVGLMAGLAGLGVGILGLSMFGLLQYRRRRSRQRVVGNEPEHDEQDHSFSSHKPPKLKRPASIVNHEFGGVPQDDVSTIGDPLPPGMMNPEHPPEDPTTAGSASSLPWDVQQQVRGQNSSVGTSVGTSIGGETASQFVGGGQYVSKDDATFSNQYCGVVAQFDVVAPPGELLGLVLETRDTSFPVVHLVKAQSPLADMVAVGDRLLKVDGQDTLACSNVNALLQKNSHRSRNLTFGRGNDGDSSVSESFKEEPHDDEQPKPSNTNFWQPWSNSTTTHAPPRLSTNTPPRSPASHLLDTFFPSSPSKTTTPKVLPETPTTNATPGTDDAHMATPTPPPPLAPRSPTPRFGVGASSSSSPPRSPASNLLDSFFPSSPSKATSAATRNTDNLLPPSPPPRSPNRSLLFDSSSPSKILDGFFHGTPPRPKTTTTSKQQQQDITSTALDSQTPDLNFDEALM